MKIKWIANIATILCMLSVSFFIGIMIINVLLDTWYRYPIKNILILIISVYAVIVSISSMHAAIKTRGFLRMLILEAFYLAFLVLYSKLIADPSGTLLSRVSVPFTVMTYIPCILSMILEAVGCIIARKHIKDSDTPVEHFASEKYTKIDRIAMAAAAFCILSVSFYIGIMSFAICFGVKSSRYGYTYFFSADFWFVLIMSVYAIIALAYVLRAMINTRILRRALIIEAFYLVFLIIISSYAIISTSYNLSARIFGGCFFRDGPAIFFLFMIYVPCIISVIFEARAYILRRKQTKPANSK